MSSLPRHCQPPSAVASPAARPSSAPGADPATPPGDGPPALHALISVAYRDLLRLARAQMRRERPGHLLEASALVHEAFLRLADSPPRWENLTHFFATASQVMRQVLIDSVRREHAVKRGSGLPMASLADPDFVEPACSRERVLDALEESLLLLAQLDIRKARVVHMRFFSGMNYHEIGEALGLSAVTVRRDWSAARVWLRRQMRHTARPSW